MEKKFFDNTNYQNKLEVDFNNLNVQVTLYAKSRMLFIMFTAILPFIILFTSGGIWFKKYTVGYSILSTAIIIFSIIAMVLFVRRKRLLNQIILADNCKCLKGICTDIQYAQGKKYIFSLCDNVLEKIELNVLNRNIFFLNIEIGDEVWILQYLNTYYVIFPIRCKSVSTIKQIVSLMAVCMMLIGMNGFFACVEMNCEEKVFFSSEAQAITNVIEMQVDTEGDIYIANASGIMIFDENGIYQYRISFPSEGGRFFFAIIDGKICAYTNNKEKYYEFDMDDYFSTSELDTMKITQINSVIENSSTNWNHYRARTISNNCEYKFRNFNRIEKKNILTNEKEVIKLKGTKVFPLPLFHNWILVFLGGSLCLARKAIK